MSPRITAPQETPGGRMRRIDARRRREAGELAIFLSVMAGRIRAEHQLRGENGGRCPPYLLSAPVLAGPRS
jgi:hypothetical protein